MVYNHVSVTIRGEKYVIRESLYEEKDNFDYGPAFSLWDDLDKKMLAKANITYEGTNEHEFTVKIFDKSYKRKGIETFLMGLLIRWAKKTKE